MASYYASYGKPPPELMADPTSRNHLKKLYDARHAFMSGVMSKNNGAQTVHERIYHDYWQDVLQNEEFWFSRVYSQNSDFCEWTVGILGVLATIRRQRGDVETCLQVLKLDTRVLEIYRNVADPNNRAEQACLKGLTYKYNLIVVNANSQMRNKAPAIKAFRQAVEYEIEQGFSFEQQQLGFFLQGLSENYMNMKCLNSAPDDYIWSVLMQAQDFCPGPQTSALRVEPWICDGCGAVEELCGDYKKCSGCKKAAYCGKVCQTKHWKTFHKKACRNKNATPKIKVDKDCLKIVANKLLDNFADTVLSHTGKPVSVEDKQAAFPGLVQFFKDFLVRRPEFNISIMAFKDANRDAEFTNELHMYIEQQPGYGSLVEVHQMPKVQEFYSALVSPDKSKELLIDEETIGDYSTAFAVNLGAELSLTTVQKQNLTEQITSAVIRYILDHPEHNSYGGFDEFRVTDACKNVVGVAATEFFELEGLL